MRLWSLHPGMLDTKGLVALWREALLAQHVLLGKTRGYKNHPQLDRFKNCRSPVQAISNYLHIVAIEAGKRNYNFNSSKIAKPARKLVINVTRGQVEYELEHLKKKLLKRDPEKLKEINALTKIKINPMFKVIKGDIEAWEVL